MKTKDFINSYGFSACSEMTEAQQIFVINRIAKSEKICDTAKMNRIRLFLNNWQNVEASLTDMDGNII